MKVCRYDYGYCVMGLKLQMVVVPPKNTTVFTTPVSVPWAQPRRKDGLHILQNE